jgi:hypothetical protein
MDRRIAIVLVLAVAAIGAAALVGAGNRSNGVSETTDLNSKPVIPTQTGTPPTAIKKEVRWLFVTYHKTGELFYSVSVLVRIA